MEGVVVCAERHGRFNGLGLRSSDLLDLNRARACQVAVRLGQGTVLPQIF